ncbi:unnamed protein product [Zymoseptoria tritici ST99CH_3D7]|uniref:RNA polymerase I-specific transcription initiation factor RRN6-like protein n=1 Tax=Zymoseptoria tritici (strain ST99CH_3D7) TaxID=1276538 RepID=A0A1X7RG20_ZYMT9|nr:unnamed protein product [Zymoseptoria tritici ST99CH_3D7]
MAERFRSDLPYGHFGRGNYSLTENVWNHVRHIQPTIRIQPLGGPKFLAGSTPENHHPSSGLDYGAKLRKRHEQQIKTLVKSNPDLQATSAILADHLRTSELVQAAIQRYDSTKGSLIAISHIFSESRHRPILVSAYATGEDGSDLCLVRVQDQKQGWTGTDNISLNVPTMYGEHLVLPGKASILQVRFSSSVQPGNVMLGIRTQIGVVIYHPTQRKASSAGAFGSRLVLDPLYTVSIGNTSGVPCSDFAFNPWFPQQLAIVDQAGQWEVLEFRTRKMDRVDRRWTGSSDNGNTKLNDGWARITWIANIETVAICTRTSLKLVNISADEAVLVEDVTGGLSGSIPWILDFGLVPDHMNLFLVLTTTHIVLYEVGTERSSGTATKVILKLRHFRSPDDTTLRLNTWIDADTVVVMLQSSLLNPMTCYSLRFLDGLRVFSEDPFEIDLTTALERNKRGSRVADIHIQPVKQVRTDTGSSEHESLGMRFFAARMITTEYKAVECLLYGAAVSKLSTDESPGPPDRMQKLRTTGSRLSLTNFVVDDSIVELDAEETPRGEPVARRRRRAKPRLLPSERTIDLERVTRLLQRPVHGVRPLQEVLDAIATTLRKPNSNNVDPLQTLYGDLDIELMIDDIHVSSDSLRSLLQILPEESARFVEDDGELADPDQQRLVLRPLSLPPSLKDLMQPDMSATYNAVVQSWVTSLSAKIPGRVRLAKAKLASSIAAELVLACNVLRVEARAMATQPGQAADHSKYLLDELGSSQPTFSQQASALPTPSTTPSIMTASSHPSTFAAPELERLSKYTTFSKPTSNVLPRSLTSVLSHWKIGSQPEDYDWLSTSRNLAEKDDEEDEDMTERERKRLQRRAERHIRRQRKEVAAAEASQLASSQAPAIFSASQPLAIRQVESQPNFIAESSQMTAGGGSFGGGQMSQVVAGRFGGRPPARKKRKQGF